MVYYPKPINREGILIFGDGDESLFGDKQTSKTPGYSLMIFRPLDKMRWRKQIQDNEYDQYDRWVKKIYKTELCIALNDSPEFPTWLILCDYHGNEDTPSMQHFGKLINTLRDLKRDNIALKIKLNRIRVNAIKEASYPDAESLKHIENFARIIRAVGTKEVITVQQQSGAEQVES